ncbi:hypothetical protein KY019_000915 [Vibrio cholerae]|uniref:hypothetical protein n=1 Tax=Vibrio cholerae TaxID=666 RepID=UPI000E0A168B|nr:hypothetical protein [Vibrio cholerae]EHU0382576.1 hypothetical protein [Vibrio cholerae]EJL6667310.1 hypothetical protein [Vibrio cholerae]
MDKNNEIDQEKKGAEKLKLYGINLSISSAEGYQVVGVMAESEEDAIARFRNGERTGNILFSEVEVQDLEIENISVDDVEAYFDWKEEVPTHVLNQLLWDAYIVIDCGNMDDRLVMLERLKKHFDEVGVPTSRKSKQLYR